jgi:predicted protein tyrosine phosphatase
MPKIPKFFDRFVRHIDVVVLGFLCAISIAITVFDAFGMFASVPILKQLNLPLLIVLLLSFIGLAIVVSTVEQRRFEDKQTEFDKTLPLEFTKVILGVGGIRVFKDSAEQEEYQAWRISPANKEHAKKVCDLTWKEKISPLFAAEQRVKSHGTYEESIDKACDEIEYREIFVFSERRRREKLLRRLKANKPGYLCRYFDIPHEFEIPRLQFMLIDGEEIIFASSSYPKLCAIRHKELGEIFQKYFDDLWNKATPIREGKDHVNHAELEKIFKEEADLRSELDKILPRTPASAVQK